MTSLGFNVFIRLSCLWFVWCMYLRMYILCNEIRLLFVMNKIKMGFKFLTSHFQVSFIDVVVGL